MESASRVVLYSSPMSDCSSRLRITLNLKSIPYTEVYVSLGKEENYGSKYTSVNPHGTVPTLAIYSVSDKATGRSDDPGAEPSFVLTQSLAAMEYLNDAFPGKAPLMPTDLSPSGLSTRAAIRTLTAIIATDTHPLTTHRVGREVVRRLDSRKPVAEDESSDLVIDWDLAWMRKGLEAYEKEAVKTAGRYSVGDAVTMADVVLLPEVWTASRFGADISSYETVARIVGNLEELEAIKTAKDAHKPED